MDTEIINTEFEKLKGFQKRALAESVGMTVEELSRAARQAEGGAAGAEAAKGPVEKTLDVATRSMHALFEIADYSEEQIKEQLIQNLSQITYHIEHKVQKDRDAIFHYLSTMTVMEVKQ